MPQQRNLRMSAIAKHWIDGEWTGSGAVSESVNPATGAVLGQWADGGYKQSGIGRLRGPLAITEFQEAKTVVHSIPAR
jgi:acyl-CoA reductase-like NAD-dependent aldehyde dehydrogenase